MPENHPEFNVRQAQFRLTAREAGDEGRGLS